MSVIYYVVSDSRFLNITCYSRSTQAIVVFAAVTVATFTK
jgi:hypothetical protein